MITSSSAKLLNLDDYGIAPGNPADIGAFDCESRAQAIAEIAPVLFGYKKGRKTFTRPAAELHRPGQREERKTLQAANA
jgi:cytosine deaminase